jgi:hypothetical protein
MTHSQQSSALIIALEFIENLPAAKVSVGDILYLQYLKTSRSESRFGLEENQIEWLLKFAQQHGWDFDGWKRQNDEYTLAGLMRKARERKVPE